MKKTLITLVIASIALAGFAQETKTLKVIDNKKALELTRTAMKYVQNGQYDNALETFNAIPYGNTYWDNAQYEKAYIYELQEKYSLCLQTLEKLYNDPSCNVSKGNILTEMGNCYDEMGNYEKATEIYSQALELSPYNYNLYFNKGVSLMRQEKYEEALTCFKQSLFLAPGHSSSHFHYGLCCLHLGYTIPGIMALNYCTLFGDQNKTLLALRHLSTLYSKGIKAYNDENNIKISEEYKEKNRFYQELMDDIEMYSLTSKTPKAPTKVNHPVAQFNYLVLSNVKARPNSYTIEDQLYAPVFEEMIANKKFDLFTLYQFSGTDVDNNKVGKLAEKKATDINKFLTAQADKLEEIPSKGLFRTPSDTTYVYNEYQLSNWGVNVVDALGKEQPTGTWHVLTSDGKLESCHEFENGVPVHQIFYSDDNRVAQSYSLKNGKPDGTAHVYCYSPFSDEQRPSITAEFSNGAPNGSFKRYSNSGLLESEYNYVNGKQQGEAKTYYPDGQIKGIETYDNDEPRGLFSTYYPNGQLYMTYIEGAQNEATSIVSYHANGKVDMEGQIRNGALYGKVTHHYPNGTISSIENYNTDNKLDGECSYYYRNGNLSEKAIFENGKTSVIFYYGPSGLLRNQVNFKNGVIVSVDAFNPDKTIKETVLPKNKRITYNTYRDNGTLLATRTIDVNGELQGTKKSYYANGKLLSEQEYQDNKLNGVSKEFYPSGNLKSYAEYKDDHIDGLYITYFDAADKIVEKEGYARNDSIFGAYYTYYPNGEMETISNLNNEGKRVSEVSFYPNGRKEKEIFFHNGLPLIINNYDIDEKNIHSDTTHFGCGTFGFSTSSYEYSASLLEGNAYGPRIHRLIFADAPTIADTTMSYYSRTFGKSIGRYPTGEINVEKNFINDMVDGTAKYYDPLGKLITTIEYELDKKQGNTTNYYPSGKTFTKFNYLQDELEGLSYIYAPDGKTVLAELFYSENAISKYAFMQKNGKMSEMQDLDAGSKEVKAYYLTGKLAMVLNLDGGLIHGELTTYYPNGQAAISANFRNQLKDGEYIAYYENGKTYLKTNYLRDDLNGDFDMFYDNGQRAYEGHYVFDQEHDLFMSYDKNGKITNQRNCHYGIPQ